MLEEEETVCVHCQIQCWVQGDNTGCSARSKKFREKSCMEGFFVRLLLLDDIRENQKSAECLRSTPVRGEAQTPEPTALK